MRDWTGLAPDEAHARLRRRWESGEFLTSYLSGARFPSLSIPLRPPSAALLAERYADVATWAKAWQGRPGWRIEMRTVGGRLVGANELPARAWVDSWPALWRVLGVAGQVATVEELLAQATSALSSAAVEEWVRLNPMTVLAHAEVWPRLLAVAAWARSPESAGRFLREIDVAGVDTKFVERHRAVLCDLLDRVVVAQRIQVDEPRARFERRYGFATKPQYARLRRLDGRGLLEAAGPAELTLRHEDLAARPLAGSRLLVVENEITYLALPALPNTVAMLGAGYRISGLHGIPWLVDRAVLYWGDVDTHGFRILDRLRRTLPHAVSVLMDRATLLDHEEQWGTEPAPTRDNLTRLAPEEAALYADLVENRYGLAVRLEQERVYFPLALAALR